MFLNDRSPARGNISRKYRTAGRVSADWFASAQPGRNQRNYFHLLFKSNIRHADETLIKRSPFVIGNAAVQGERRTNCAIVTVEKIHLQENNMLCWTDLQWANRWSEKVSIRVFVIADDMTTNVHCRVIYEREPVGDRFVRAIRLINTRWLFHQQPTFVALTSIYFCQLCGHISIDQDFRRACRIIRLSWKCFFYF